MQQLIDEFNSNRTEITRLMSRQREITAALARRLCDVEVGQVVIAGDDKKRARYKITEIDCWECGRNQFKVVLKGLRFNKSGDFGIKVFIIRDKWEKELDDNGNSTATTN